MFFFVINFSRAPSSVAKCAPLDLLFQSFFKFFILRWLAISPRPPTLSSPHLQVRWQMGGNGINKLLGSELYIRGGWDVQKGHFRFRSSFTKCNAATK